MCVHPDWNAMEQLATDSPVFVAEPSGDRKGVIGIAAGDYDWTDDGFAIAPPETGEWGAPESYVRVEGLVELTALRDRINEHILALS